MNSRRTAGRTLKDTSQAQELHGKTMLIVGLGGIGTQIARRADAFGMRVMAIDPNEKIVKPAFRLQPRAGRLK